MLEINIFGQAPHQIVHLTGHKLNGCEVLCSKGSGRVHLAVCVYSTWKSLQMFSRFVSYHHVGSQILHNRLVLVLLNNIWLAVYTDFTPRAQRTEIPSALSNSEAR